MGHSLRVWMLLAVIAWLCVSCLPVTDTLYPVLNFKTARPIAPGKVSGHVMAGTASMLRADPDGGVITISEVYQAPALQAGLVVGVAPRVDVSGEFLYGFGWNTGSPGVRLGSRMRLSPGTAPVVVSLAPALLYTGARDDGEDDTYESRPKETLRSSLLAGELRIPVTVPVNPASDVTLAAGIAAMRFNARFNGYHDFPMASEHYSLRETEWQPLYTVGVRYGLLIVEAGAHRVHGQWESAAGVAIGKQ